LGTALVVSACGSGNSAGNASNEEVAGNTPSNEPADNSAVAPPKEAAYPYQVNAELARVYLKYNIVDEALRLFDLAIAQQLKQTGSEDAENWSGLGDALARAKRLEEAALAYNRALQIYKQLLPQAKTNQLNNFYIQKIAVLCQVLNLPDERKSYLAQLKADEKDAGQQIELAGIFEQLGQKEKAETCYKRAVELSKEDPQQLAVANIAYAGMLLRAERLDEALVSAKAAYETKDLKSETKTAARRMLFNVYEARGEAEKMEFK
jgi:tetratricopeptide (TPR) repeat protein